MLCRYRWVQLRSQAKAEASFASRADESGTNTKELSLWDAAARLAQEIAAGRWSEGEPLPGVRKLAREVGCSAGTAARAYRGRRELTTVSGYRSTLLTQP